VEEGARLLPIRRLLVQLADNATPFKMQGILIPVPIDPSVKELRGILGGTGTQTVEAQGIFVVGSPGTLVILAACVHLAEDQLPVVALLLIVPIHGASSAEVLYLNALICIAGHNDQITVSLTGLVNGIGQDLKDRMLTAYEIIGAENDRRAETDAVFIFQGGNTFVAVALFLCHNHPHRSGTAAGIGHPCYCNGEIAHS